ncbi:hypothetical protein BJ741DRAFT_681157 [Chytriomyces cf. hyalinus JEL632]|nr:hypothetical protein BJ741DRAFT_681157 [Chytriomyces cf. hyalinus JEL632]
MDLEADSETPTDLTAGPAEPSATVTPPSDPTIRPHTNNNNTLEEWTLNAVNVDAARTAIWNKFRDRLERRAIFDESANPPFTISDSDPAIEDIDSYLYFEKDSRKHCFGPKPGFSTVSNVILTNWSKSLTPVTLLMLKHGDAIRTTAHFQQYDKTVLQPIITDRAGAPAEVLHTEIIAQLHEQHGSQYRAGLITWRLWANEIQKLPVPQQANAIREPPPSQIIQLFDWIPAAAEERLQELRSTMNLAREVLGSCHANLEPIKLCAQDLMRRVESFELVLAALQRAVDGLQGSLGPIEVGGGAAFNSIPNMPDIDHEYLLADS